MKTARTRTPPYFTRYLAALILSLLLANSTQAATATCTNAIATPVAHYTFDNTTLDDTANGHDPVNTPVLTFNSTDKIEGSHSGQYDGAGMQLNDGSFFEDAFSTKSVSMFIKPSALDTGQVLFDEGDSAIAGISLILDASGNLQLATKESGALRVSTIPFPADGGWHHVGFVYDGSITEDFSALYLDGYPVDSAPGHATLTGHSAGGGLLQLFGSITGGSTPGPYTGLVDEVAVFNTALTPKNMLDIATGCGITDLLNKQGTMVCDGDGYVVHTVDENNKSIWRSVDLVHGTFSVEKDDTYPGTATAFANTINAIGYNPKDSRIWGYNKESADGRLSVSVLDAGGNWTSQVIGSIVGLVVGNGLSDINTGAVKEDGSYYMSSSSGGVQTVWVIDLDPGSADYLTLTDTFSVTLPSGHTPDWAFHPDDGKLYGINNTGSRLLQITPGSGGSAATVIDLGAALPAGELSDTFGAVYFDDESFFYIQGNTYGRVYRLDLRIPPVGANSYSATGTIDLTGPGTSSLNNDGTRCVTGDIQAPTYRDFGDIDAAYIKTSVTQDGARHALIQLDEINHTTNLMIGSHVDAESDVAPSATANIDTYEDGVVFTTSLGDIVTATVSVTNTTGKNAILCGWLDANRNETFESGERQCSGFVSDPGTSFDWTLNSSSGNYFSRFRLCDIVTDCENSYGIAANGEVEDYIISYNATNSSIEAFRITSISVDQALTTLDTASMSARQLHSLLSAWDKPTADSIAEGSREEHLSALRQFLDPDGNGKVALLRWQTVDENGTVGFFAERRSTQQHGWQRINEQLLPGLIDAPLGGEYILLDPGGDSGYVYHYRLIEQEAWGSKKAHGPYELGLNP